MVSTQYKVTLDFLFSREQSANPYSGSDEVRLTCPFPECADKPADAPHRSLAYNRTERVYYCHRCKNRGILESPPSTMRQPPPKPTPKVHWRVKHAAEMKRIGPLNGSPGEKYLQCERGISPEVAALCNVRFSPDYFGRPAVVFPLCSSTGELVAVQGRYLSNDSTGIRMRTIGDAKFGAFLTPGVFRNKEHTMYICEAPIDAMSLYIMGCPALAVCGTNLPGWVLHAAVGRNVFTAADNDAPGIEAANKWRELLQGKAKTLKSASPFPHKDWNDMLRSQK